MNDDDQAKKILQKIVDLASLMGWSAVMAQDKDGYLSGIYIGSRQWLESKTGSTTKDMH